MSKKKKRDLNEVFDTATIENNVNHLLKGDKARSQFLIEQLNIPKAKFTSLITKSVSSLFYTPTFFTHVKFGKKIL